MKRYFNMMKAKQVVAVEFSPNSVVRDMDISSLFGGNFESNKDIVEITKREFILLSQKYQRDNDTNLSMTIIR